MIEICSVGGYDEVGKNCTAIKVGDEVVICDMGLYLESYIKLTEDEDAYEIVPERLIEVGAVPNINSIKDWKKNVKAIVPTHAHLDHVGAIPFLADKYDAPVICTPFTGEVLKESIKDNKVRFGNKIKQIQSNSTIKITDNIKLEFVHVTHSTPHTAIIALHTKEGIVLYANDFKFDLSPTLGKKPNFKRLMELGKQGVHALIVDSTYAPDPRKMPSESIAKQKLRDVLIETDSKGRGIIVTTFSSHIARLNSIVEFSKKLNRKVIFMGRSLSRYSNAAENAGIINFSKDVEFCRYGKQIKRRLRQVANTKQKYLLVVTGHQGEPKSTLSKIATGEFDFKIDPQDHVVFSSRVIPTPVNINNSAKLDGFLKQCHARIFRDIHESGHAAREDLRDMLNIVKPKHLIPAHGDEKMKEALAVLSEEMGYKRDKTVHIMSNGDRLKV
tara:strand:+ start:1451 stop:2779 length:1329 start_codon:yes stop_codon:yes gene_type:complete